MNMGYAYFLNLFVRGQVITLLTKDNNKELVVYVCDIQDDGRTFVCNYYNKTGIMVTRKFDVTKYNFCL